MAKQHQARQIAQSIPAVVGSSTIADLETKTDAATATAARSPSLRTGRSTNFSGQYLYDRFVIADKQEITKLNLVRQMAEALELDEFKKSVNGMVEIAVNLRDAAIKAAEEAKTYNKDNPSAEIRSAMARVKTAQNHQTVMRNAYGALSYAGDHLLEAGYTDDTGYQTMAVISRQALKLANIKWDGSTILTKDESVARAQSKAEAKALDTLMKEDPRKPGEGMKAYLERVADKLDDQVAADRKEAEQAQIAKLAKDFRKLAGGYLEDVVALLLQDETPALDPEAAKEAAKDATKH